MPFANDAVMAISEDDLQRFIYNLNTVETKYNMETSSQDTKALDFQG
jgi:hypothetical protein